jgi:plasmid stabilization system protein ParE
VRIAYTPRALRDIDDALDYITADSVRAAQRLLAHLGDVIQRLGAGELNGPEVRLRGGRLAYRWSVPPYRLYYRRTRRGLIVLRVYHQARRSIEEN